MSKITAEQVEALKAASEALFPPVEERNERKNLAVYIADEVSEGRTPWEKTLEEYAALNARHNAWAKAYDAWRAARDAYLNQTAETTMPEAEEV